ncbi:hypothetical protein HYS31_07340 [Candidatus Woesearchaeota archaeon]|nr:hypothetical protein [Candidatus Woesearchaeota archaeon]
MYLDKLTDDIFFKKYQEDQRVRDIVDKKQMEHGVHASQTKTPDENKAKAAMLAAKRKAYGLIYPPTRADNGYALAAVLAGIAFLSGVYIP